MSLVYSEYFYYCEAFLKPLMGAVIMLLLKNYPYTFQSNCCIYRDVSTYLESLEQKINRLTDEVLSALKCILFEVTRSDPALNSVPSLLKKSLEEI